MILRLSELRYNKIKCILCFLLLYLFVFLFNYLHADEKAKNPFNSAIPLFPASYTESSFAPLINPVFSDISPSSSISYMMQNFEDRKDFNHYFLLNYAGFIFSYSWIDHLYNYNDSLECSNSKLFTVGKGFFFNNMFGLGANYSFSKSSNNNFDGYKSLTIGLLFRPVRFLSFGYTARDINNPRVYKEDTARSNVYSLSIRPFNNITFSFDAVKYEGRDFEKSDMILSSSLRFIYDISAYAGITKDKNLMFGLLIPLGINGNRSSSIIFDGYTSDFYDMRSSGLGVTFSGDKTESSIIGLKRFLKIMINNDISEIKTERIFSKKELVFFDLLNAVKSAKTDQSITGIIIQIDNAKLGFAQIQELREELKNFRSVEKPVYAILNALGNKEYYLASACDKIYYNPANMFAITGLKAEVFFFKEGLDKIGVKFESVSKGPYKSYPEPYTREHMSREFRENLTALISDLNEQYLNDIIKDRQISSDQIDLLFKKGIMTPLEAIKAGFIDEISYPTEAETDIFKNNKFLNLTIVLNDYVEENKKTYKWGPRPKIAVIYVSGSIVHGYSQGYDKFLPNTIGDETYLNALNSAFTESQVNAVVIRIDSGGGSSLASELMLHNLIRMKKKYNKPVVFSFGNTAASGGYYIACTGDNILSSKGTVTGSIGVVAGKLSLKELYSKLGINKDIIKMSEFADIFSEAKDMTAAERKIIEQGVDYVYNRFKIKASEARGIAKEDIDKAAEGRVFTGSQAKNNRLIDTLGGIIAAIDLAKKIADIKDEYDVTHLPEISVPLMDFLGIKAETSILQEKIKTFIHIFDFVEFNEEYALYYCPYKLIIK
ncbi:MAG: signal peptide peptidase SppA [Spirochaetes bacterium]|nr:signal peptide peptidase SppA [Spirochaetota bacterium]